MRKTHRFCYSFCYNGNEIKKEEPQMTRKLLALVVALMMMSAVALADVPAFEDIVFPDVLPAGIIHADETYDYSYDDLSVNYALSIMTANYGTPNQDNAYDPVVYWLNQKLNMDIAYESVSDLSTTLSTRAAAEDLPDLFETSTRDFMFALDDSGLLIDAKTIYPYMPLSCQYATANMVKYTTNTNTGRVTCVTGYGIQDGVWSNAIRADWLEKFEMDFPTTLEEVYAYAEKCTYGDPDGDGVQDSWFITNWGTIQNWFATAWGNNQVHVAEDGTLSHPYFNGVRYQFLSAVKYMNEQGWLAPDWYTMDWATQKIYYANDQVGALYYPVQTLLAELVGVEGDYSEENCEKWAICTEHPFGYKYVAAGDPGYMWCFTAKGFAEEGKVMRAAHMIDTMRIGGEYYEDCMQGGTQRVYEFYAENHEGVEVNPNMVRGITYTDEGYFYLWSEDKTPDNKDDNSMLIGNDFVESYDMGAWQHFGLAVAWQLSNPNPAIEEQTYFAQKSNEHVMTTAGLDRYPNSGLLITLTGEASEAQAAMSDWIAACEIEFINGDRELTEESYAEWTQEWLEKGGEYIVEQQAECLGCELAENMQ